MTQTLQQLFGPSATQTGTTITLNFNDFSTTGLNGTNPSAASILYALLKRLDTTLETAIEDPTAGVSASAFKPTKSFVTRGTATQVQYPIQLNFYKADNAVTLVLTNLKILAALTESNMETKNLALIIINILLLLVWMSVTVRY